MTLARLAPALMQIHHSPIEVPYLVAQGIRSKCAENQQKSRFGSHFYVISRL